MSDVTGRKGLGAQENAARGPNAPHHTHLEETRVVADVVGDDRTVMGRRPVQERLVRAAAKLVLPSYGNDVVTTPAELIGEERIEVLIEE